MRAVARLLYRRLRPELIVAGGACIGLALAAVALARLLDWLCTKVDWGPGSNSCRTHVKR